MRKLFVSFTSLVYGIAGGRVSDADLMTGLFAFGCTREHAMTPGAGGEYVERGVKDHPEAHSKLVAAVLLAEGEGRVAWRKDSNHHTNYELVSGLLVKNGIGDIDEASPTPGINDGYCYPGVRDRVEHKGYPIEVYF